MSDIETREFDIRAVNTEERTVAGIAVPYGVEAHGEIIQRDAVQPAENVQLFWRHEEPIGRIIEHQQTANGWEIKAKISDTPRGNEAYTLVKDGVINKFSIGFRPVEHHRDNNGTRVVTKANVVEVSLVPEPWYDTANLTEVRESATQETEETMQEITPAVTLDDLAEVREIAETVERQLAQIVTTPEAPAVDTRSAGEVLHAIATGEETRAYEGATTAETVVLNGWVGDLTRIVTEAAPLRGVFNSAALPAEGNYVEYATLTSNTIEVDAQGGEGADLTYGELVIDSHTSPVVTYGGYSELSRQSIERSSVAYLNHVLNAQAAAAGKAINGAIRAKYVAEHAAQVTATNTVSIPATGVTYADWLKAAIDAQVKMQALGLTLDALIVDAATFKGLLTLEAADGRPVFLVTGAGSNNVGTLQVTGLAGSLASIPVIVDAGLTDEIAFVNRNALTFYGSSVARLQDENVINLSKSFSVYMYGAVASTVPAAIIPVVSA